MKELSDVADLLDLTTEIVTGYVTRNGIEGEGLPTLIKSVYDALVKASLPKGPPRAIEPAVPIQGSVFDDHIICLMCGKNFRTLKRHLQTDHELTISDYRARFGLPHDYPMIAQDYAEIRARIARSIGLGRAGGRGRRKKG